jgi:predicted CXXCH cytochrome family protein
MRRWGWLFSVMALTSLGVACLVLSSCSTITRTVSQPPQVEGAHFVGNQSCAECHTNIARSFPSSPHARFHSDDLKMAGQTGCESCHGAGSKHVEAGGSRRLIVNPGKNPEACLNCHLQTHAEFRLPQHHPVLEHKMNCVQCHDPHGADALKPAAGLAMARINDSCAACHREQARPFVYEHEAMREGCTTCHNPHGSVNQKMLVERDANLCLKCHAQVQGTGVAAGNIWIGKENHTPHLRRGGCWSAGCHNAVHGSNLNPHLRY